MKKAQCHRCKEKGKVSYYEYEETRVGGYDGAFSPLVRGTYNFYKCPECGAIMADPADWPIRR
jgi:hypothetical protein